MVKSIQHTWKCAFCLEKQKQAMQFSSWQLHNTGKAVEAPELNSSPPTPTFKEIMRAVWISEITTLNQHSSLNFGTAKL